MAVPLVLFAFVLVLIGAAVAVPVEARKAARISEADAPVLGASVLSIALGGLNLVVLVVLAFNGDVSIAVALLGLAPIAGGAVGLWVVYRGATGSPRAGALALATLLVLVGVPSYLAPLVAVVVSVVTAGLFLSGLMARPQATLQALLKRLDPRL